MSARRGKRRICCKCESGEGDDDGWMELARRGSPGWQRSPFWFVGICGGGDGDVKEEEDEEDEEDGYKTHLNVECELRLKGMMIGG